MFNRKDTLKKFDKTYKKTLVSKSENWKFNNRDGVEEILFDKLKQNTKKLKCFELQMIGKAHQVHQ